MAVLLSVIGAIGVVYGLVATELLAAATFTGPVFGVLIGLPLLGVGVVKGIEAARARSG